MKYTFTLFVTMGLCFTQVFGQCATECCKYSENKTSRWMFGVEAGAGLGAMIANRNYLGFANDQSALVGTPGIDATSGLATSVGVVARYQVGWLSLRSGISYDLRGVYLNDMPYYKGNTNTDVQFGRVGVLHQYVNIPLLLDSRIPFLTPNFRFLTGGYIGLSVGTSAYTPEGKVTILVPFIGGYQYPIDAGLQGGMSYQLPINALNRLEIKATYTHGVTVRREPYIEAASFHRVASLSVGWLFSAKQVGKWFAHKALENEKD